MNKNKPFRMRKPAAAALFAIGACALCIALFLGSRPATIAGWTPVNESLEETLGLLAPPPAEKEREAGGQATSSADKESGGQAAPSEQESGAQAQPPADKGQEAERQPPSSSAAAGASPSNVASDPQSDVYAEAASPSPMPSGESGEPVDQPSGALDLNRATEADLDALPGIGPSKAKAIIAHRDKIGGFRRVEQLLDVKGIGPKVFERLSALVYVAARK
ncbi:ComEA family DNA-binding protein [Cohnella cellulosilytica]|uniref:ComEA family DNA-binding protein n=1 Tax=Cohnella cellulosilytica TaxID=986710 RepID=A0ABW2F7U2_9BACL